MSRPVDILIIDDSEFLNNALSETFKECSPFPCRIYQAFSLKDARQIIKSTRIDFVILDLVLPDGNGEEFLSDIPNPIYTKTIVLTSQKQLSRREYLYRQGVLDYFSKENPIRYLCQEIFSLIALIHSNCSKTIMIIDDSSTVQKHVADIFHNRRYKTVAALSAQEAFSLLEHAVPDLILLDLEMPHMRGDTMLHRLKESEAWLNIPVLVMTGSHDEETKLSMMKRGAFDVVNKPYSIEVLIAKAENAIAVQTSRTYLQNLSEMLQKEVDKMSLELREKQEMINNQMRQVAMGEMLNAITHQWMQPLNMISLISEDLVAKGSDKPLEPSDLHDFETRIDHYIHYMKEIATSFKNFFKPLKTPSPFSIIESIEEVVSLFETRYSNLSIMIRGDRTINAEGYKNEFQQVIVNLLDNAKEAVQDSTHKAAVTINLTLKDQRPQLSLHDNGKGLDPAVLKSIFKPYVTTKENGNGIGLYLSQKILHKIGATISVSNSETGTEFIISF